MSDFTFRDAFAGTLKFNDENIIHISLNADTEDFTISKVNLVDDTVKTIEANFNDVLGGGSMIVKIPYSLSTKANVTYNDVIKALQDGHVVLFQKALMNDPNYRFTNIDMTTQITIIDGVVVAVAGSSSQINFGAGTGYTDALDDFIKFYENE